MNIENNINKPIKKKKTAAREWFDAILFAVIAATIIRIFTFEAYTIPTPSMERSLMVGDYLFVSKLSYGARLPMTPLAVPLVHNVIPIINTKSYFSSPQLPYYRLPGLGTIKNSDVVVFNYPMDNQMHPIDKTDNYIKRCVAIPNDTLEVRAGVVYINNKPLEAPKNVQMSYTIETDGTDFNEKALADLKIYAPIGDYMKDYGSDNRYVFLLNEENKEKIKTFANVKNITPNIDQKGSYDPNVFPFSQSYAWNKDHYGKLWIPKKDTKITLNTSNLPFYQRIIEVYEGNKLEIKGNDIYVNGVVATEYTFKMDYYFMMGDNRHNSLDSRFWGFVPENHIVGKAVFVWLSIDANATSWANKIRWSNAFRTVK